MCGSWSCKEDPKNRGQVVKSQSSEVYMETPYWREIILKWKKEHRYTYQIAQPHRNFCWWKLPEMKNKKLKRKWLNIQSFSKNFDSKLLKNDPVDHKYYYFIMVNWGERLKS